MTSYCFLSLLDINKIMVVCNYETIQQFIHPTYNMYLRKNNKKTNITSKRYQSVGYYLKIN